MAKMSKKQKRAYDDLVILQAERRRNFTKMILAGVAILVLTALNIILRATNIFPSINSYFGMLVWGAAIILAFFFAGPASINLTKSKKAMNALIATYHIDEKEFEAYKRGELE